MEHCNVYKTSCLDCNSSYVGQTKRKLITKIQEHKRDKKSPNLHSVISSHQYNHEHDLNWMNDIRILDSEPFYKKRSISKMIFIKNESHSINK